VGKGFFASAFKIECASGSGETNLVESQQSGSFTASLEKLSFSSCSGGCTVVKVTTPQEVLLGMETDEGDDWRLKASNVKVAFSGCAFGVECEYEATLSLKAQMDAEGAFADPEGASFKLIRGSKILCGESGKWETGRTRLSWKLDDEAGTTHKVVYPSLLEGLTTA
jgi:hypothetical protein